MHPLEYFTLYMYERFSIILKPLVTTEEKIIKLNFMHLNNPLVAEKMMIF